MKITLADIAAHAEVSTATVSRVLNGKPGIADETRRAVLQALEALNYSRVPTRRRLGLVGLMVQGLDNPVFPRFVEHLSDALVAHGYFPMLCSATPVIDELEHIDVLLECGVIGMVIVAGRHANIEADHSRYRDLRTRDIATVFINGFLPDLEANFVSTDDVDAVESAYRHLYNLGHRRIGCAMGPARYITTRRKVAGFIRAVESLGDAPTDGARSIERDLVVYSVYSVEGGQSAGAALLDRGVTAVVCGSDQMALGVIRAAHARGLKVPEDLSVIGYDDSPVNQFTNPPLTTMRQNAATLSIEAVNALVHDLRHRSVSGREQLVPAELIVRGSTAPPKAPGPHDQSV